ncbi:hypothetical protein [Streptomyces longispororuber]|uniref:hypothetical protein n=1 Tax=Streptomyces longispororuber TaxID=68230 RepID=UPI0036F5B36F
MSTQPTVSADDAVRAHDRGSAADRGPAADRVPVAPASAADPASLLGDALHTEVVEHFTATTGAPREYVERQVTECLRYLYLVSLHPDRLSGLFLPVEQEIDEIWHYLILQTREYRDLCEHRLPGGFFVEHRSIAYDEYQREPGRERAVEQALRWIPLYVRAFGPFDEGALPHWTIVRFLHERLDMSLAEISALPPAATPQGAGGT